ncbi:MAG TPA: glycosyltransferase family 4 protein [Gemmatimonadales bacterium]|jgi:glycosyltransferase involved in cell wall biosynthesis
MSPTPLTVSCISVSSALGGSEWSLLDFVRLAAAKGIDAGVVLPKEGPLAEELKRANVRYAVAPAAESLLALSQREMLTIAGLFTLTAGLATWSRAIAAAGRKLFGAPPQVLYTNGFKPHLAASLVRGPKRAWHLREFPPERTQNVWKLLVGALPTVSIANSRAVADAWRMAGFKPPEVVHNGVDLVRFHPMPRSGWIHAQLGLDRSTRLIGMPAIFAKWKGHLQVVEAFEHAAADFPDAHLVLVGGAIYDTSAERGFAEELVRRVGRASVGGGGSRLSDRIHFLKHSAEPWKLYPEFDVVVHFSTRPEPFGRVVAEALASGVPVIAARAGGPLEIVEDGVTGWLVEPGDVTAMSAAMVHALREAGTPASAAMRAAARARAETQFSAERYATEVARILREAAR